MVAPLRRAKGKGMNTKSVVTLIVISAVVVGVAVGWHLHNTTRSPSSAEIRVLGEASSNLSEIGKLAPEFTRQTGIKVNIEAIDFETARTRADTDLSQRTGRYDIVLQYNFALS